MEMSDQDKKVVENSGDNEPEDTKDDSVDLARRMLIRAGALAVPAVVAAFAISKPAYAQQSDCDPQVQCVPKVWCHPACWPGNH